MNRALKCIMLVDDNADDNFFHEREIKKCNLGNTIIIKDTAEEALAYSKSREKPHADLIFLDINMPGMNGWEFLQGYNKLDNELQSRAIVIMLTTSRNPDEMIRAKEWDFVRDYIIKPLTQKILQNVIQKYF